MKKIFIEKVNILKHYGLNKRDTKLQSNILLSFPSLIESKLTEVKNKKKTPIIKSVIMRILNN